MREGNDIHNFWRVGYWLYKENGWVCDNRALEIEAENISEALNKSINQLAQSGYTFRITGIVNAR